MELHLLAPNLGQITVYILYKYSLHKPKLISYCNVYGVSEIWTFRKRDKKRLTSIEMNFSNEQPATPIPTTKGMYKFWESAKKNQLNGAKKTQIRLAATCSKNEHQNAKNNGEF